MHIDIPWICVYTHIHPGYVYIHSYTVDMCIYRRHPGYVYIQETPWIYVYTGDTVDMCIYTDTQYGNDKFLINSTTLY